MRIPLVALMVSLSAVGCGHDPLTTGPGTDGPPPPDTTPWVGRDAGPDLLLTADLAPPDVRPPPDLARDTRPDGVVGASGLDRSRPVASLTDAELGRLCDWGLAQLGGYGSTLTCTDGTQIRNSPSRQACIAGHTRTFQCIATVGDSEDCLRAIATQGCSQALFFSLPACRAMFTCQGA